MPAAVAAPSPVTKPERRPSVKVRRIQSTPMGPTGAAMEKPMMRPRSKKLKGVNSSISSHHRLGLTEVGFSNHFIYSQIFSSITKQHDTRLNHITTAGDLQGDTSILLNS